MPLFAGVGGSSTVGPANGGKVWAVNVASANAQVLPINAARVKLSFHLPITSSEIVVFVYPMLLGDGTPNNPTLATSVAGSFVIYAGGYANFEGECQGAWGAFCNSTTAPLSIMESNLA